jgi:hypothetical protein
VPVPDNAPLVDRVVAYSGQNSTSCNACTRTAPRNGPRARPRAYCGGVVRPHDLPGRRCPLPVR